MSSAVRQQIGQVRQRLAVRQAQHDAVVGVHDLDLKALAAPQPPLQGHGPGGVDAGAEGGQDADAPVAEFVAKALDDDGAVVRDLAGGLALVVDVGGEVGGGQGIERCLPRDPVRRVVFQAGHLATKLTHRASQLDRSARPVAAPERQLAGFAGGRRDDDPVAGDLLDPPTGRAEQDALAGAGLEDHLLVQLADARSFRAQMHGVVAAVRDGAGVQPRDHRRAFAGAQPVRGAVPGQ